MRNRNGLRNGERHYLQLRKRKRFAFGGCHRYRKWVAQWKRHGQRLYNRYFPLFGNGERNRVGCGNRLCVGDGLAHRLRNGDGHQLG